MESFQMSNFISSAKYLLYIIVSTVVLFLLILRCFKRLREKSFPILYAFTSKRVTEYVMPHKSRLFGELSVLKSADAKLRKQGLIRVLELGAGPGHNFQFYPKNTCLITVEPNQYFTRYRNENLAKYPAAKVIQAISSVGEDMSAIEDNSIDAVVATFVLCSVCNIDKVLMEIHRILVPNGKYYFLEHGYGKRSFWQRQTQKFFSPIWKICFDDCVIARDGFNYINNCKLFKNVKPNRITPDGLPLIKQLCLNDMVYGTAVKIDLYQQ
ncbi:hypothetical protein CHUAL_008268 [Chamberlinius hualienensis]